MKNIFVNGKRLRLKPQDAVGKGGEADVYKLKGGIVLKLWKPPDHPDYLGLPEEQENARRRLDLYQEKMLAIPRNLPLRVVAPLELANDGGNRIVGYTMKYLNNSVELFFYSDRNFRARGIRQQIVSAIFLDLWNSVESLHHAGVIIGDFNDMNVLVKDTWAYLIDSDSYQFAGFPCTVCNLRFLDPLLCDPKSREMVICRPYTSDSDWYSFSVMLMQSFLLVGPYGGIHRPADPAGKAPHDARVMRRITIFDPDVRYPKPAIPYQVLPDDLLHHFQSVFVKDLRGRFPRYLLESVHWETCPSCGLEHGRSTCPACSKPVVSLPFPAAVVRGSVAVTTVFQTAGQVVACSFQGGKLRWLFHDNTMFRREGGEVVMKGALNPWISFRILGDETLAAFGNFIVRLARGGVTGRMAVDRCGTVPAFDTNDSACFRAEGGRLIRDDQLGPVHIGDVLAGQTRFWVGTTFGFGFYRAGEISVGFIFETRKSGINDSVLLPPFRGKLVTADCYFSNNRCWFLTSSLEGRGTINRCAVIGRDGKIEAEAQATAGDGSWLSNLRGKCAIGHALFTACDEGILRLEPRMGRIVITGEFPDTEPFVDRECDLINGGNGLVVVLPREIRILRMV